MRLLLARVGGAGALRAVSFQLAQQKRGPLDSGSSERGDGDFARQPGPLTPRFSGSLVEQGAATALATGVAWRRLEEAPRRVRESGARTGFDVPRLCVPLSNMGLLLTGSAYGLSSGPCSAVRTALDGARFGAGRLLGMRTSGSAQA